MGFHADLPIPEDLATCWLALDYLLDIDSKRTFKESPEENLCLFHNGLGRAIRNKWDLWNKESSLREFFDIAYDLQHPDDISGVVIHTYWRKLNNKPLDLMELVSEYKEFWENNR